VVFWPSMLAFIGYFAVAKRRFSRGELWILSLILPSMVLVLTRAPELRYNFGVFIAPIALLTARVMGSSPGRWRTAEQAFVLEPIPIASMLAVAMLAVSFVWDIRHSVSVDLPERLWLPRQAPSVEIK